MGALRGRLLLVALALLLGVALYGILGAATGLIPSEEDATLVGSLEEKAPHEEVSWPPEAWRAGDLQALSLHELAYLVAGTMPGTDAAADVDDQLGQLDELPPRYTDVAYRTLYGLAEATWHQQQAQAPLTSDQRALLAGLGPTEPPAPETQEALARLDHDHLALASDALTATAADVQRLLDQSEAPTAVGDALREALDPDSQATDTRPLLARTSDPGDLVTFIDRLTDPSMGPSERTAIEHQLAQAPEQARQALGSILEALLPFAEGAPADEEQALVQLGDAIDRARPTLEVWSAQANAARHVDEQTLPPEELDVPDPNVEVPPLRIAHAAGSTPPEAPANLTVALRDLALAFNDSTTAANANTHVEPLQQALPEDQQDALATTLAAMTAYLEALEAVPVEQTPAEVLEDPGLIEAWASMLEDGDLVPPGSEEAQTLLDAQPYLDAVKDLLEARGGLLEAAEDLVPQFSQPASSSNGPQDLCQSNPDLQRVEISFYLHADFCGIDQTWDTPAMLTLDTGGENVHTHRAAAPFNATDQAEEGTGSFITLGGQQVWAPIALTFDLGGSTEYRPTDTEACTLGSTCPADVPLPGFVEDTCQSARLGSDNIQSVCLTLFETSFGLMESSIAVLVDWDEEKADAENVFIGADASQASATQRGSYTLLVERAGADAVLSSTYRAGERSQGVAGAAGASGTLVRLVGDDTVSTSTFQSGDESQGAVLETGASHAVFLNLAGQRTVHHDEYHAGDNSQASSTRGSSAGAAVFMDFAGRASQTNDTYVAGDRSQGWWLYSSWASSRSMPVFISGADEGSISNDRFQMPDGTRGRGHNAFFLSAVPPTPQGVGQIVREDDGVLLVDPPPGGGRAGSDDVYLGAHNGYGRFGPSIGTIPTHVTNAHYQPLFLDLGGNDTYPDPDDVPNPPFGHSLLNDLYSEPPGTEEPLPSPPGPCDNCAWFWGMDASWGDTDGDAFPDLAHALWPGAPLWEADSDDEDESPSPTPARALIDVGASDSTVDRSYAFVLNVGGDDVYTENASAGLLFDLAGDDRYEGYVGAVSFDLPQHTLAFALDLGGDDEYVAPGLSKTQGYADGGGSGLLFNLAGENTYWANSHAQGAANGTVLVEEAPEGVGEELPEALNPEGTSLPGLGFLFDGTDPVRDELNIFRVRESPSQGEGQNGGTGILVAAGEDNRFASGGETAQEAVDEQDPPDLAREFFEDVDAECERDDAWPSPGARCSQRAGERVEGDGGGYGLRVNLGEPADPDALEGLSLAVPDMEEANGEEGEGLPAFDVGEDVGFLAEVTHREGDDVTFDWGFELGEGKERSETVTKLGSHDGEQQFSVPMKHAWTRVDDIEVTTEADGTVSGDYEQVFSVSLDVTDPRGGEASTKENVVVEHKPLPLLHLDDLLEADAGTEPMLLLGPRDVELDEDEGAVSLAYQLPVNDTRGQDRVLTRASWLGGTSASYEVDWAHDGNWWSASPTVKLLEAATSIRPLKDFEELPDHVDPDDAAWRAPSDCQEGDLMQILDPESSGGPTFQIAGSYKPPPKAGFCPAVHFDVELPEPRQVHEVNMTVGVSGLPSGATFVVHGVAPNGSTEHVGTMRFDDDTQQARNASVDFGVYESFIVRQQIKPRIDLPFATIEVTSFQARGPGVIATPPAGEAIPLHVGIVDDVGAVNKTIEPITIDPGGLSVDEVLVQGGHPLVRIDGIGERGSPHHMSLVTNRAYTLTVTPTEEAHEIGGKLCILSVEEGDASATEVGCEAWEPDSPLGTASLQASLDWDQPGNRTVHWQLSGGALEEEGMVLLGDITTVHVEPGLDLAPQANPLLLLLLGDRDHDPQDTWHYADRDRGVPNYVGVVDAGGNDRYAGDHAVPPPLTNARAGARPSLLVDAAGDDDYLSTGSFTQGYGYFGRVGVLWDAGGDDRYVAASHAQGTGYKFGIGLLVDQGGDDAYNPMRASHPALPDYLPTTPDPAHGLGERGPILADVTRAMGAMPDAELVQGAADDGIGMLLSGGGYDLFAAGQRAQGYGQHGVNRAERYVIPGDTGACGEPVPPVGNPFTGGLPSPNNVNPNAAQCWLGVIVNPNDVPLPSVNSNTLNQFLSSGPRYGPGVGVLAKDAGPATYHARGLAQGASGPDGRGLLVDADGGFVGSVLQEGQGFSDGGQAGLFAGGEHSIWTQAHAHGFSRNSTEHPEYPARAPADRPVETNHTVYARTAGQAICGEADTCGEPTELKAPASAIRATPTWSPTSDIDGNHEKLTSSTVEIEVDLNVQSAAGADEVDRVEVVAITQPWATGAQSLTCERETPGALPLSAPVKIGHSFTQADDDASFTLDLDERRAGQPVYPAGCHTVVVLARAVDDDARALSPWERLEGEATLLPPPQVGLFAQQAPEIVSSLENQSLALALASGQTLPLVDDQELEVAFVLVHTGDESVQVPLGDSLSLASSRGPEAFHLDSPFVEHGFVDSTALCGQALAVEFHNVPDEADVLAYTLLRNSPDLPVPANRATSWHVPIPPGQSTVHASIPNAPCPRMHPASIDQPHLLYAYALGKPVKNGEPVADLDEQGQRRTLLHGNVRAQASMAMTASPTPMAYDWGPLGHTFGVREDTQWGNLSSFFDAANVAPSGKFEIQATASWAGTGSQADPVGLGTLIVDQIPKETTDPTPLDPVADIEGTDHWKRTEDLPLGGMIEVDPSGEAALPTGLQVRAVFEDDNQGHQPILPGTEMGHEETAWVFAEDPEGGLELQVVDEHAASPIQVRLTEAEDAAGDTVPVIEWEILSLDLLPSTEAFRGGLVEVQAVVSDEAGNHPSWDDDAVASHRVFFDAVAPTMSAFQTPDGTTATNDIFPINLTVMLEDEHAGVNASRVSASMLDDAFHLHPLDLNQVPTSGQSASFAFRWDGQEGPEEGAYEVVVEAEDRVGNRLLVLPGTRIDIDRGQPLLDGLDVRIVEDQAWVGNGTTLAISVDAEDPARKNVTSGLNNVTATFAGDAGNVSVDLDRTHEGDPGHNQTLLVPGELTAQRAQVPVNVTACDRAGNCASLSSQNFTYYPFPPWVVDEEVRERSESIAYDLRTDRPTTVDANATFLRDPLTNTMFNPEIDTSGHNHTLVFDGLRPDTPYEGDVVFHDEAGYTTTHAVSVATMGEIQGTGVTLDPIQGSLSGMIEVSGTVVRATGGTLSLHAVDATSQASIDQMANAGMLGTPIDAMSVSMGVTRSFSFDVDTQAAPFDPDVEEEVAFVALFSDEANIWWANTTVRIDNAAPRFNPVIQGPDATNGWFNGPVIVHANAQDATEPILYRASLNDGALEERRSITVREDGTHTITFQATDGAVPANEGSHTMTVRIDRTTPALNASINASSYASNRPVIPLSIEANESLSGPSGLAGFRVNTGGDWTPWTMSAPERLVLQDAQEGERWIEVQLRDKAGNVAQASLNFVLDRTPPSLLEAQWTGGNLTHHTLRVIAQDRMEGPGLPAGVEGIRWAVGSNGAWHPWQQSTGRRTLEIPHDALQGEGMIRLQVRDLAGNLGGVHVLRVGESLERAGSMDTESPSKPTPDVFARPMVTPSHGTQETRFTFSIGVYPWDGQAPTRVWVTVGDQEIDLEQVGLLDDGARLYSATSRLDAVDMEEEPSYRFHAAFPAGVVSTSLEPAPFVTGAPGGVSEGGGLLQGVPAVRVGVVLVAVVLCALAVWRFQGGRDA